MSSLAPKPRPRLQESETTEYPGQGSQCQPARDCQLRQDAMLLHESPFYPFGNSWTKPSSHISDGITADIISQLAGLRELAVISHGSTFDLRDPGLNPREIGRKLDV